MCVCVCVCRGDTQQQGREQLTLDVGRAGVVACVGHGHLGPVVGVGDLTHGSVEADVQPFTEAHWHTRVPIPH